ncbi:MAG: hypothetical protein U1F42_10235 [Candidatus Competibacteraceae bacterium]
MFFRRAFMILATCTLTAFMTVGNATIDDIEVDNAKVDHDVDPGRKSSCTNASLRGTYGFVARGTILVGSPLPPALQGPFASGGTSVFDGQGHFTLTSMSSFNGVIQPVAVKGIYQVNSDCSYTSQAENGVTFRAMIVDEGRELLILQTTSAVVIAGIASRQPSRCDRKTLQGTYGFIAEGAAGPPTLPPALTGPLAGVGTVVLEQEGTFVLTATRSANGVIDPEPLALTGTYTLDSNCTFSMAFDVGFTFKAMIVNSGKEILFVETDPGTALIVKAKKI